LLVLHQFEISPFCDKIRRVLHAKGLAYQVREVPVSRALGAVRKLNPIGKLPALVDDGHVVVDSTDIAYYLEQKFPTPALLPADPRERALCHVLEDWADESLYYYEMTLRFALPNNRRRWLPELTRHDPGWFRALAPSLSGLLFGRIVRAQGIGRKPVPTLVADVERHVAAVEGLLGDGEWLVGGALSLADIAVFAQLSCIRGTDEGAPVVAAKPRVGAWLERVDTATRAPAASRTGS
jgi:glutathione S-transferase